MATDIIRPAARPSPWRNPAVRGVFYQILFVAFVVALGVVAWFLRWVRNHGLAPFAIYRILFGMLLLLLLYRGAIGH